MDEVVQIGPHYAFDTALNSFCLRSLDRIRESYGLTCDDCEAVLAVYVDQQLLPEAGRCRGVTARGYRCQHDGHYDGYCASHLDQDPMRPHLRAV